MIYDSHVHTTLSVDADTLISDALHMAEEKNIGLVVTDHLDWDFPAPFPDFRLDVDRLFREYGPLRSERLLLGVELGMTERSIDKNREIIRSHDFDFVLGSVHVLDGVEVEDSLYRHQDEAEVYRRYLTTAAQLVSTISIDALAHVDYPLRTTSRELPYGDYRNEFGALFAALLEQDACLELNTSRLGDAVAYANLLEIYRAYRTAGGRYVTLGSDAHEPGEIADHFNLAAAFLRESGLTPVHYRNHTRIPDTI